MCIGLYIWGHDSFVRDMTHWYTPLSQVCRCILRHPIYMYSHIYWIIRLRTWLNYTWHASLIYSNESYLQMYAPTSCKHVFTYIGLYVWGHDSFVCDLTNWYTPMSHIRRCMIQHPVYMYSHILNYTSEDMTHWYMTWPIDLHWWVISADVCSDILPPRSIFRHIICICDMIVMSHIWHT